MAKTPLHSLVVYVLAELDQICIVTRQEFWKEGNEQIQNLAIVVQKTSSLMVARKTAADQQASILKDTGKKYEITERINRYTIY